MYSDLNFFFLFQLNRRFILSFFLDKENEQNVIKCKRIKIFLNSCKAKPKPGKASCQRRFVCFLIDGKAIVKRTVKSGIQSFSIIGTDNGLKHGSENGAYNRKQPLLDYRNSATSPAAALLKDELALQKSIQQFLNNSKM